MSGCAVCESPEFPVCTAGLCGCAYALPTNDDICSAAVISEAAPFAINNRAATAQDGEDQIAPPPTGCETQTGWCDDEDYPRVTTSVWFKFTAESSCIDVDTTTPDEIYSDRFDSQVALYKAASDTDCPAFGELTLIAANDDGFRRKFGFFEGAQVEIGANYWLQVDGYDSDQGRSEGILRRCSTALILQLYEVMVHCMATCERLRRRSLEALSCKNGL